MTLCECPDYDYDYGHPTVGHRGPQNDQGAQ